MNITNMEVTGMVTKTGNTTIQYRLKSDMQVMHNTCVAVITGGHCCLPQKACYRHVLKLNGTHQLLAYADDVNVLGGNVHAVQKNTEALVAAAKEIGLEVNANKTKYMVMS
jgi:hypothetical protein